MNDSVRQFYGSLARDYHLMYADWRNEVPRQGKLLDGLIRQHLGGKPASVLDCTCGIGTQAIGLATQGYRVHATDLSPEAVARAKREAETFGVTLMSDVADVRALETKVTDVFDVVVSFDNSFSHLLEDADLLKSARQIWARLRMDGLLLISIRDYDQVVQERLQKSKTRVPGLPGLLPPSASDKTQPTLPRVFDDAEGRRIVFQIWDWADDERSYTVNHFHVIQKPGGWETHCYVSHFRALQRHELSEILHSAGFSEIRWLMPEESGYYQPIVSARKR